MSSYQDSEIQCLFRLRVPLHMSSILGTVLRANCRHVSPIQGVLPPGLPFSAEVREPGLLRRCRHRLPGGGDVARGDADGASTVSTWANESILCVCSSVALLYWLVVAHISVVSLSGSRSRRVLQFSAHTSSAGRWSMTILYFASEGLA